MTDYTMGDKYYLPAHADAIAELVNMTGDGLLHFDNGGESLDFVVTEREAFLATHENYDKLSQIWPDLERPKMLRPYQDVLKPTQFKSEHYKDFAPVEFPCLCWVTSNACKIPMITLVTSSYDSVRFQDACTVWRYAIPLTQDELNQLAKLNKEASNG